MPAQQLATLQSQFDTLQQNNMALQQRLDSLVPIETPELSGNALYLDRSVSNVTYTGAVC